MRLGEAQELFAHHSALLIPRAEELGFAVRRGEAFRTDEQCVINAMGETNRLRLIMYLEARPEYYALALAIKNNGKANGILFSLHGLRLAEDLLLFRNGVYLTASEDYRPLGEWWEQQHPLARWGGRFQDGGHFSFEWEGRR